jgi:polyhydroxybutyrate depolymerase
MQSFHNILIVIAVVATLSVLPFPVSAQDTDASQTHISRLQHLRSFMQIRWNQRETKADMVSEESLGTHTENVVKDFYGDRDMILYVPSHLPEAGQRSMVVALHGAMGNARFMQDHLKMDGVAEKYGFIVAYLNGSRATPRLPDRFRAWNAGGGCCGQPYTDRVDDIGYITGAVHYLEKKYGVDPARAFGTGYSNGAIMTQTLICATGLYQKAVSLAGSLMAEVDLCPAARSKEILAIHGKYDQNIPPGGGRGAKSITHIPYHSEVDSQVKFRSSGGSYHILWIDSDHSLAHMAAAIQDSEGISLAEKEARFFGLSQQR